MNRDAPLAPLSKTELSVGRPHCRRQGKRTPNRGSFQGGSPHHCPGGGSPHYLYIWGREADLNGWQRAWLVLLPNFLVDGCRQLGPAPVSRDQGSNRNSGSARMTPYFLSGSATFREPRSVSRSARAVCLMAERTALVAPASAASAMLRCCAGGSFTAWAVALTASLPRSTAWRISGAAVSPTFAASRTVRSDTFSIDAADD